MGLSRSNLGCLLHAAITILSVGFLQKRKSFLIIIEAGRSKIKGLTSVMALCWKLEGQEREGGGTKFTLLLETPTNN